MKKYFIKSITKAATNNNFYCGEISESIWGENYQWIEHIGSYATGSGCIVKFDIEKAKKYGFSSIQEAEKSSIYKSLEKDKSYWETILLQIIAIEL